MPKFLIHMPSEFKCLVFKHSKNFKWNKNQNKTHPYHPVLSFHFFSKYKINELVEIKFLFIELELKMLLIRASHNASFLSHNAIPSCSFQVVSMSTSYRLAIAILTHKV